ncbi:MAG: NAD-dependent epimerase/dehydratase family protein [Cypionkella sp.]
MTPSCTIVTGAAGRVGRALRCAWWGNVSDLPVQWSARNQGQDVDIVWDIGKSLPPPLPENAVFLHLAGQTRGNAEDLAENRRSAQVLCESASASRARHVFLMSSGAVYAPSPHLITEDQRPKPVSDYGRAKLEAEDVARDILPHGGLTILRLGNLAGADALLSSVRNGPVTLDPIEGQQGGPERSYIGPRVLAQVLQALIGRLARGEALPPVLNIAQPPVLSMADLLTAAGADWRFGPPRPLAIPRVALSVDLLAALVPVPVATAVSVVADLRSMAGAWP